MKNGVGIERLADSGERGTAERRRHDPVAAGDVVMRDGGGAATVRRVYQVKDVVDRLWRRGDIGAEHMARARRFQQAFHTARLDQRRAADLNRVPGGGGGLGDAAENARGVVGACIKALGGYNTPVANAAWDVLGLDMTIAEYAKRQAFGRGRALNPKVAKGLLLAALAILETVEQLDRNGG